MSFTFKIRNGNNIVYAFDNSGQLADKAWTANGFTVNTANSHYLTVTVNKYAVVDGVGGKKLDLSWSRTASDGNTYKEGGVYVVSVSNRYQPNGDVSKTFYVGNDPYVRAIPITGKTLDEIVDLIKYTDYDMQTYLDTIAYERKSLAEIVNLVNQGWTIDSGKLIEPPTPTPEVEEEQIPEEEIEETASEETEIEKEEDFATVVTSTPTPTEQVEKPEVAEETHEADETEENVEEETNKSNPAPIIVFLAITASAGGVFFARNRNKK